MPTFFYKASNSHGKTIKGNIEADNEQVALNVLYAKELIPVEIFQNTHKQKASALEKNPLSFIPFFQKLSLFSSFSRVPKTELSNMITQLAVLLKASLPLEEALQTLCSYEYGKTMKSCLLRMRDRLLNGTSLADCLQEFPHIFSQTFISMVRAGEESGTLEIVIEQYADHLEKHLKLMKSIYAALTYPIFMLVVGFAIVIFLLTYVVPQISAMFTTMDKSLPFATELLLNISAFFRNWWFALVLFFVFSHVFLFLYKKTKKGQKLYYKILLKTPFVAKIYRQILVGQFTRTLGMLLHNGVSLLKALNIVKNISQNTYMVEVIENIYTGVQEGYELSTYLKNSLIFSPIVSQMVHAGEKSGQVPEMLLWVAKDCEGSVATKLQVLTALLEPLLILVLGAITGFVVIAIMLPIFEMSNLVV